MNNILIYCIGLVLSIIFQIISKKISLKYNLVDMPGERKVHTTPIPRIGGIGIFVGFSFIFFMLNLNKLYLNLYIGTFLIFILNLIDDIKKNGINNKFKLFAQMFIVTYMYFNGFKITLFINNDIVTYLITLFWFVGITNSFNLLDNMNGLSAGLGIICSVFFMYIFYFQNSMELFYMCGALIFGIIGFYIFNFPKATMFMGDSGANVIGFLLAGISVSGTYIIHSRLTKLPVIAPLIILSLPIYDTLSVMIIRKFKGYSVFRADTNHISHRLTYMGFSKTTAVLIIYFLSVVTGLSAVILSDLYINSAMIVMFQLFIFYILITILVYVGKKD